MAPLYSLFISLKIYSYKLLISLLNFKTLLLGAVLTVLAANQLLLFGVVILTILDTITGVWCAKKNGKKIQISNILFKYLIEKFIVYSIALISGIILEISLGTSFIFYTIGSAIIMREASSIFIENLDIISNDNFFGNLFRSIFEKIKK